MDKLQPKKIIESILPRELKTNKCIIEQVEKVVNSIIHLFLICPGVSYEKAPMFIRHTLGHFFLNIYKDDSNGKKRKKGSLGYTCKYKTAKEKLYTGQP